MSIYSYNVNFHMRIESLIRLLAGLVVLFGVALAALVSKWWLLLPAFAGVNLIQSAVTGFCPPGLFLRRIGWLDESGFIHWGGWRQATDAKAFPMSIFKRLVSPNDSAARSLRGVSPQEAANRVADGAAVLIDVREPAEWTSGVAKPANLLPMSDLSGKREKWAPFLASLGDRELILYCHSGGRSGSSARLLAAEGFSVANLGGFKAWRDAGLPVRKP
jgi:rhodanese-related sulfurtransferase